MFPAFWLPLAARACFTQPRDHSLADPCTIVWEKLSHFDSYRIWVTSASSKPDRCVKRTRATFNKMKIFSCNWQKILVSVTNVQNPCPLLQCCPFNLFDRLIQLNEMKSEKCWPSRGANEFHQSWVEFRPQWRRENYLELRGRREKIRPKWEAMPLGK